MVLTTQVRAKLFQEGQRAPQAHSSGAQGRWKVTSTTRVRYKLDPELPWETISPFRRLVPERVPDRAFCLMELAVLGIAAKSGPQRPQVRILSHRSHTKLVLVHRYARNCTSKHTLRWISRARGHTLKRSRLHRCVRNCELEEPLSKPNVV